MEIPQVTYGSLKHEAAHGLAQCHSFTLIQIRNKQILLIRRLTRHFEVPDKALHEIQVRCLIDNLLLSKKMRERRLREEWVSERRSRINTVLIIEHRLG